MITRTIGGERLGSGNKMKAAMRSYERSTHDLGYLWRSSMSAGTLVPFMCELALPGDTFDINLDAEVRTHPTLGPLFGSYKLQIDIFEAYVRLYNAQLHNNAIGIGMNIASVIFPLINLQSWNLTPGPLSYQINPSCLLAYLGIRGIGYGASGATSCFRQFNAMPIMAYWEIFKNYYANKQETNAYVIHSPAQTIVNTITSVIDSDGGAVTYNTPGTARYTDGTLSLSYPASTAINNTIANQIRLITTDGITYMPSQIYGNCLIQGSGGSAPVAIFSNPIVLTWVQYWRYMTNQELVQLPPVLTSFPLANIDLMREAILQQSFGSPLLIQSGAGYTPYNLLCQNNGSYTSMQGSQESLAVKTYQSDINNNWIQTSFITGTQGASTVSAISTASGSFTIDTLNLSKKVYDMLNRIALSGGSYKDWIETVYTADSVFQAESPMYCGGLSKEVLFQEVVSLSAASTDNAGQQPLGTLAGKGMMGKKHKGGNVVVKVREPSYIIGIVSLTPRIDYSQGNKWIGLLQTMNDLHKPALDEIGFQNLVTDQLAYWDTTTNQSGTVTLNSAGMQPAWLNYMTNVNQTYGNFAIPTNEMFMTLNRQYAQSGTGNILDLTTYIDPSKYNFIFAQTSLDSQNFWTQIAVNITARRKMSAKIIPNL